MAITDRKSPAKGRALKRGADRRLTPKLMFTVAPNDVDISGDKKKKTRAMLRDRRTY